MCEEESDDAEAVAKLLEINDSIHRTVERYKLMKAGNVTAANNIPKGTLGTTTGVGRNAANELSLIDFDLEPSESAKTTSAQAPSNSSLLEDPTPTSSSGKQTTIEDDLLGLSIGGSSVPTGGINLGGSTLTDLFNSPAPTAARPPGATFSPPPPGMSSAVPAQAAKSNYDAFSSLSSALPRSKPATPVPGQQRSNQSATPASDPFAILSSGSRPTSRPATPSLQTNGNRPASGTFQPSALSNSQATAPADDDWNFVSAPPAQEPALPQKSTVTALEHGKIKIIFECMRQTNQGPSASAPIFVKASFTNLTSSAITGLHFQIAVEKAYTLQLQPQSGKDLAPNQQNIVVQNMLVSNVPPGKGTSVKIRFKASYTLAGAAQEEQGMITGLGVA